MALHIDLTSHPSDGYKLLGTGLNGPSRGKLDELVRFMFAVEALEDAP